MAISFQKIMINLENRRQRGEGRLQLIRTRTCEKGGKKLGRHSSSEI